jgi:hypothetical protein
MFGDKSHNNPEELEKIKNEMLFLFLTTYIEPEG